MYRPEDSAAPRYPVFEKVNGRIIPFVSAKGAAVVVAAALLAVLFIHFAANLTRDVTVALTQEEVAEEMARLESVRNVAALDEISSELEALTAASGTPRADLGPEELERYYELVADKSIATRSVAMLVSAEISAMRTEAKELGITSSTTDEDLFSLIDTTKTQAKRIIGSPATILIALIIVSLAIGMVFEPAEGRNLYRLLVDMRRFNAKQHEYLYARTSGSFAAEDQKGDF